MAKRPRVCILHTGGTIGMLQDGGLFRPERGHLATLLARIPELDHPSLPSYELVEFDELLDSSNMTPVHWAGIATAIAKSWGRFDGYVVLHGTDTLSYTASALSFILEGLDRPVVVTGSQIPLCLPRNDARENLISALVIAGTTAIPEVCVYFNGALLRGNRCTKVDADRYVAFASPNFPPLGKVGGTIEVNHDLLLPRPRVPPRPSQWVTELGQATVGAFRIFPGLKASYLRTLLAEPLQGLVLECFGAGNAPVNDVAFLEALLEATSRGVVIVAVTQCLSGTVHLDQYQTGARLAQVGVVSGGDMLPEAALAKLLYLLEQPDLSSEQVGLWMTANLRGELTPEEP